MKIVLAVLGVALIAVAGIAGFTTVSTDSGVKCGSWIIRDSSHAKHEDYVDSLANSFTGLGESDTTSAAQQGCRDSLSDRTPIVLVAGVLGIAALLGAGIVYSREPKANTVTPPSPL